MKFLHLGDLHIGKSLLDFSLIDDQGFILDQIIGVVGKRKVDAVLIAGDIYDRAIPSEEAVSLFGYFLRTLATKHIKTFAIIGNHDLNERLTFGSSLFEANHAHAVEIKPKKKISHSIKVIKQPTDI